MAGKPVPLLLALKPSPSLDRLRLHPRPALQPGVIPNPRAFRGVRDLLFPARCHPEPRVFCGVSDLLFASGNVRRRLNKSVTW